MSILLIYYISNKNNLWIERGEKERVEKLDTIDTLPDKVTVVSIIEASSHRRSGPDFLEQAGSRDAQDCA